MKLANQITGLGGLLDDNVWNTGDKGAILISDNKKRYFKLADDGTFKIENRIYRDIVDTLRAEIRGIK